MMVPKVALFRSDGLEYSHHQGITCIDIFFFAKSILSLLLLLFIVD